MAGNSNRDLTIRIDGEEQGVDRAFKSAAESAKVFDRALETLERQQKQQEEQLRRAEEVTKSYGRANAEATDRVRKLGIAAAEAGEKAAASQEKAREAAERLSKGEIKADEAAQAEARALRDVERAAIAMAASQRASAKAAEDLAKQENQAARDAVVAAGTERLAHLKAAGAVKEHNDLLKRLRKDYKEFDKGFDELKTAGQTAFTFLRNGMSVLGSGAANLAQSLGPGMVAIIIGALAALPAAATLIGGGITLGLGGALAAVGLKATMGSAVAKRALDDLKAHASGVMQQISKPFEQTWVNIADAAKTALDGIAPDVSKLFAHLAPELSGFANQLGRQIPAQLHNFFGALQRDFGPIISELGDTLPQALGRAADGLAQIMNEVAKNPQEFGNLISATGRLVQALGTVVVWCIKVGEVFTRLNAMTGQIGNAFQAAGAKLGVFGAPLRSAGALMERFDLSSQAAGNTLMGFAGNMVAAAAATSKTTAATNAATQSVQQLHDAFERLVSPALAYDSDQIAMKEGALALTAALKQSHGALYGQSAASRAATLAFIDQIKKVEQMREDQKALYGATVPASQAIKDQVLRLWELAGSNKTAQDRVIRLAANLGVTLPTSARKAKGAVDGVHDALGGLHDKKVKVTADTSQAYNAAAALQRFLNSLFGHAYGGIVGLPSRYGAYADGGVVKAFPGGGRVSGPGTSTSDSINARLSNGEFVVRERAVREWLPELVAINKGLHKPTSAKASASRSFVRPPNADAVTASKSFVRSPNARTVHAPIQMVRMPSAVPATVHAPSSSVASGGSSRMDVYVHVTGSHQGLIGEIVKGIRVEVRTKGHNDPQTYLKGRS